MQKLPNFDAIIEKISNLSSKLYVAYSGGIDSSVLLHLACQTGLDVTAVYCEHNQSQNNWREFITDYCNKLKVKLVIKDLELAKGSSEAQMREARYKAFASICKDGVVMLAHHQDDQVETVMMNFVRGTGIKGLAGIAQNSSNFGLQLYRPLLHVSKDELIKYAENCDISYIHDHSNDDPSFKRNYLRLEIIPNLKEQFATFPKSILSIADEASLHRQQVSLLLGYLVKDHGLIFNGKIVSEALKSMGTEIQKLVLRYWLEQHKVLLPTKKQLDSIINHVLYATCAGAYFQNKYYQVEYDGEFLVLKQY